MYKRQLFALILVFAGGSALGSSAHGAPDEETRLATRAQNIRQVMSHLDSCISADSNHLVIYAEPFGCAVVSKEQVADWALYEVLERVEPGPTPPGVEAIPAYGYLTAMAEQSRANILALKIVRSNMLKMLDRTKAELAALRGAQPAPVGSAPPAMSVLDGTSDTWNLVCCSQKYSIGVTLRIKGGRIEGSFADGSAVTGSVQGSTVRFRRDMGGRGKQDYVMTLGADGRSMSGSFSGDRDTTVGVETTMTR